MASTTTATATASPTSGTDWAVVQIDNTSGVVLFSALGSVGWLATIIISLSVGLVMRRKRRRAAGQEELAQAKYATKGPAAGEPAVLRSHLADEPDDAAGADQFMAFTAVRAGPRRSLTGPDTQNVFGHSFRNGSAGNGLTYFLQTNSGPGGQTSMRRDLSPRSPTLKPQAPASPQLGPAAAPASPAANRVSELEPMPELDDENDIYGPVQMRPPSMAASPVLGQSGGRPRLSLALSESEEAGRPRSASNASRRSPASPSARPSNATPTSPNSPQRARAPSSASAASKSKSRGYVLASEARASANQGPKRSGSSESIDSFTGQPRPKNASMSRARGRARSASVNSSSRRPRSNSSGPPKRPAQAAPAHGKSRSKGPRIIYPSFLEVSIANDLKMGSKINEGGFGLLCEARVVDKRLLEQTKDDKVAVKTIKAHASITLEHQTADFMHEVSIIYALQFSRNIIKLFACARKPELAIVTRLYGGSLAELVHGKWTSKAPDSHMLLGLALDMANGLADMHSYGIAHLDIKPANILLQQTRAQLNYTHLPVMAVLCDFGISKVLSASSDEAAAEESQLRGRLRGGARGISYFYAAPESFAIFQLGHNPGGGPDIFKAMDVYSYAMVLYEMLTRELPWDKHMTYEQVQTKVSDGARPSSDAVTGDATVAALRTVMVRCWQNNPKDRPAISAVLDRLEPAVKQEAVPQVSDL